VEVKIGVQNTNRELVLDSSQSSDDVAKVVTASLSGDDKVLVLSDSKGRKVLVPADKLAYVEIGTSTVGQVGYRS
jgi:hypothetical protein